jgi:hypothetical protein
MTEITPATAEAYIVAVATTLNAAGHQLHEPPRRAWQIDPDEILGGWIGLPALLDGCGLVWQEADGWHIGHSREVSGVDCLTPLGLGVTPPPAAVVEAVARVAAAGTLTVATAATEPDDCGPGDIHLHILRSLELLPRVAVIEPEPAVLREPVYRIHYWQYGEQGHEALARGAEIDAWIRDLRASGWDVRFGWELRGQEAPEGWALDGEEPPAPEHVPSITVPDDCRTDCPACAEDQ